MSKQPGRQRRCPHANAVVEEITAGVFCWEWENAALSAEATRHDELTGALEIQCRDCRRSFRFSRGGRRPAWVTRIEARIRAAADEA